MKLDIHKKGINKVLKKIQDHLISYNLIIFPICEELHWWWMIVVKVHKIKYILSPLDSMVREKGNERITIINNLFQYFNEIISIKNVWCVSGKIKQSDN